MTDLTSPTGALKELYEAFIDRHGCFPLDRATESQTQWNDAMMRAKAILDNPLDPSDVIPEGHTMFRISRLILMLKEVKSKWGDTCVYARDLSWGAVALNRRDDDQRSGISVEPEEWNHLPMTKETLLRWIEQVNLPEAKEVLKEYMQLKAPGYVSRQANRIKELEEALTSIHSWIVCAAIASAEDMMENAEAVEQTCSKALRLQEQPK